MKIPPIFRSTHSVELFFWNIHTTPFFCYSCRRCSIGRGSYNRGMSLDQPTKQSLKLHEASPPRTQEDEEGRRNNTAAYDEDWERQSNSDTGNKPFRLYDLRPQEAVSETPVLTVPGWGAPPEVWKEVMRELVGGGRRAIAVDAVHGIDHDLEKPDHIKKIPDVELRRIAAFMEGLDAMGVEKTDAIGHSEGALDILLAAAMHPERFRNIVLVDPAGMIGEDNLLRFFARLIKDNRRAKKDANRSGTMHIKERADELTKREAKKDKILAAKELLSVIRADAQYLLKYVRAQGVGVIIVQGYDDAVFPVEKMVGTQDKETRDITPGTIRPGDVDGLYVVEGDHNKFVREAPLYTRVAEGALQAREASQQQI
jgi:pimeloyl-ACP methyl ester carboxylesterase